MDNLHESNMVKDNRQNEGQTPRQDSSIDNQQKNTKNRRANSGHQAEPPNKKSWRGFYRDPELFFAACIVLFTPIPIDVEQVAVSEERRKQLANSVHKPAVILPNQGIEAKVFGTSAVPNEEGIENIKIGKWLIYVIGEVHYSDIFKKPHVTKLCMLYNPRDSRFDLCDKYNTAD